MTVLITRVSTKYSVGVSTSRSLRLMQCVMMHIDSGVPCCSQLPLRLDAPFFC